MTYQHPERSIMKKALENSNTIAVVGLSDQPNRISYQVAQVMQNHGYKIIPVNPTIEESLGEKAYATLTEVPEKIDIINVFRKPIFLKDIAMEAKKTDARIFWAQQGIRDDQVYQDLKEADFIVVMDFCIKVAYASL
ncbi:putative CoA-binding protein [Natronobacillus azotifigens]|uniref:CoA-binding protein n=1 Tax=Natronobacillus azotifigens TaxID=472978 RepID=A0A9J6RG12_9BACI|nr:CoA-binding protein [Natronobacillus azotifigens]MCZ0704503.1 CoA-binding protein [Natronobacillus azotifigens]